jgi:hypothetical protein
MVVRILKTNERKVKDVRGKDQFGFWGEKGPTDVIGKLRTKSE